MFSLNSRQMICLLLSFSIFPASFLDRKAGMCYILVYAEQNTVSESDSLLQKESDFIKRRGMSLNTFRQAKEPIFTRNFFCAFFAQFCLSLVMYMLMTTIGEYVTAFGATATIAGMVSGMYVFGGLISRLCSGRLLEKYDWKRIALVFLGIHFIASCCYFFAANTVMLIVIRFVHGLGFGASANAIMVIGMANLPKSRYSEAAGYFMISTSLGVAVGPFFGGIIFDAFGGTGSFLGAAVLSLLCVIFMAFLDPKAMAQAPVKDPEKRERPRGIHGVIEPKAVPIAICILFLSLGYAALVSFYRMYAESVDLTREFSVFFLLYAVVLLLSRPGAGILQDRFGDDTVCIPSFILQALGLAAIAWKPCLGTILFCAVAGALGYGTMNSCLNAIVNRNISNDRRPFAATTYWGFCDLGVGLGPVMLGAIVTSFGYSAMYFAAAFLSLLTLPVYFLAKKTDSGNMK